ncbi:helix-turn-helix domain-containing protein [Paenibacillus sp. NEAU-GSW1]|uniref:helix-turn-helix domain-containing protein n=1 Tax=Paenibacillus sp. NEAU-GSW1 TaxID=2682486 RepID=UPI0012E32B64|nr:helix-turn-helix domain-containing protein [Paenibacillus sp. NEAU-GSW1]MUT67778.1 PAS domain-containing protein [Paenibacillus sp. NEAU-GSW1]
MYNIFYMLNEPMMIVEFEHNRWYVRDVNHSFTLLTGYKKSELIDIDPNGLLKEGLSFHQLTAALAEDNADNSAEWELVTRLTRPVPVKLTCRRLPQDNMSGFGYIVNCIDLSESNWIDDFAQDNQIVMTLNVSEQFRIVDAKRYYSPLKQRTSSLVNQCILDFIAEDSVLPLRRVMDNVRKTGIAEQMELRMSINDKAYLASAIIKPFYNGNKSFRCFSIIITELNLHAQDEDSSYKLRMLMLNKNISATSLAQSTLISLTTISKIRNGKIKKPQRLTAELIAGELGVKPESIWSSFKR